MEALNPTIKTIVPKQLIGMSIEMSLIKNLTGELFRTFMPRRKEISKAINQDTLDLKIYPDDYFTAFDPTRSFVKWVAVEVKETDVIPDLMKTFELSGGLYAVFHYRGINNDSSFYQRIFTEWLPASDYQVDNRPHFDVLGVKTKLNDPESEEEIWIPIKAKNGS